MIIKYHTHGTFRLDGGAMFGSVPKNLWSKLLPADAENCVALAQGSLIIEAKDQTGGKRVFMIDAGMGEKWKDKSRQIYNIKNSPRDKILDSVTDIILTHLHFDHAGGISRYDPSGNLTPTFPGCRIYLQKANLANASQPNRKEKASYLPENIASLDLYDLKLVDGDTEIFSGITVHRIDGHTAGQQWIEINCGTGKTAQKIFFLTDLIPTHHHVHPGFSMAYDMNALKMLEEKQQVLKRAHTENAIIIFQHDIEMPVGKVEVGVNGEYNILPAFL